MKKIFSTLMAIFVAVGLSSPAFAVTELPNPNLVLPDGTTIAYEYDDFYAYSIPLNNWYYDDYLGGDAWDSSQSGSGGLDLKVISFNNSPNPSPFEQALGYKVQGQVDDADTIWGNNFDGKYDGPVFVDDLYSHLQSNWNTSIPVFYFDISEPPGQASAVAGMMGEVRIVESVLDAQDNVIGSGDIVDRWFFDLVKDHAPGEEGTPIPGDPLDNDIVWTVDPIVLEDVDGIPGNDVSIKTNVGSGHPDYVGYAPTMDLANYNGNDYLFFVDFRLYGRNIEQGDELYLTGKYAPYSAVPEPASMILFGLGAVGAFIKRRFV